MRPFLNFLARIRRMLVSAQRGAFVALLCLGTGHAVAALADSRTQLGKALVDVEIDGLDMDVWTYRPRDCAAPSTLIVIHGMGRTAESYLDRSRTLSEESCFTVYAPLFDKARFPTWSFQRGGAREDGVLRDYDEWTVHMASDLIDWIRSREGTDVEIYLFGHSAGAQFLSRFAAYTRTDVSRIIIANPSTYVRPVAEEPVPYGFGEFDGADRQEAIRRYLEAPVTIFLGLEDTGTEDLTRNDAADRQGPNRLERGRRVFAEARSVAEQHGYAFGWRLVEVPGIGHSMKGMLNSAQMYRALGF